MVKRRSFSYLGLHANLSAMTFNNAIGGSEAQSCSLAYVFGGKERFEDTGEILLRNSLPRVCKLQENRGSAG